MVSRASMMALNSFFCLDQVLKIYLYEDNGQRNLEMTVSAKDINSSGKR